MAASTYPDHLGAIFASDGRSLLTRTVGKSTPLTIRSLDGAVVRELGQFSQIAWVG